MVTKVNGGLEKQKELLKEITKCKISFFFIFDVNSIILR